MTPLAISTTNSGAMEALVETEQDPVELILRHMIGDWVNLDDEDKKENELSAKEGFRILSADELKSGLKVWVITEWDRSVISFLVPNER